VSDTNTDMSSIESVSATVSVMVGVEGQKFVDFLFCFWNF